MEGNNKDTDKILKESQNYKVVATALGAQGIMLILSGIFIVPVLALFGLKFSDFVAIFFQVAFILSGIVNLGMAFHFYKKSRSGMV